MRNTYSDASVYDGTTQEGCESLDEDCTLNHDVKKPENPQRFIDRKPGDIARQEPIDYSTLQEAALFSVVVRVLIIVV
jgi:hypothetical protein